jgi:hypothetical protein
MPHFYLSVCNDVRAPDDEGEEQPDLEAAKESAIQGARELIAAEILAGRSLSREHCIEITNGDGELLHTVRFADVIQFQS